METVEPKIPTYVVKHGNYRLSALLMRAGMCASQSEAIRKIKEGGVKVDGGVVLEDSEISIAVGITGLTRIRLGASKFCRYVGDSGDEIKSPGIPTLFPAEMTLRDAFAAQALTGLLSYSLINPSHGNYHENCTEDGAANAAYLYADAMIKARAAVTDTESK